MDEDDFVNEKCRNKQLNQWVYILKPPNDCDNEELYKKGSRSWDRPCGRLGILERTNVDCQ